MKKIIFTLTLFLTTFIYSQVELKFSSTLFDEGLSKPIAEVKVKIEEREIVTYTDEFGQFSFNESLPEGEYFVSFSKENYDTQVIKIKNAPDLEINIKNIYLTPDKKELKKRKKAKKKEEKENKKKLKEIEREKKRKEKELADLKKDLEDKIKDGDDVVEYTRVSNKPATPTEVEIIGENQKKYAKVLGVEPIELTNKMLYDFIDDWIGTPYLWGGETKQAIDCSSFTQRLFNKSYDMYLERTAQKQFDSKLIEHFSSKKHLKEGDLLFFGRDDANIVHVGVYLRNSKFVHATSETVDGPGGVKISDLNHPKWSGLFYSAGRRQKE